MQAFDALRAASQSVRSYYVPIIFIGLVYVGITMMWTLYSAYVPVFLDLDYGLSALMIGAVMVLDNLLAFIIQPWIGTRSDRLRSSLGGRLPIILAAAPFAAIAFALIPYSGDIFGGLAGFLAVVIVMLTAMAAMRVPLFALMPDLVPPERRSTANGILNLFGGLGTLVAAMALAPLYRANRAGPFLLAAATLAVAVVLLAIVLPRLAPEQLRSDAPGALPEEEEQKRNAAQMLRDTLRSAGNWRGVPLLLLAILAYTFGFNGIETFFSLLGRTRLGIREEQALMILGIFFLTYLLLSIPAGMVGERIGRRRSMVAGLLVLSVLGVLAYFFVTVPLLILFMPLGGLAWALVNSNALPAVVNTAMPGRAGSAVGLFYAATTLASILSPLVNGWLVDLAGGDYGVIMFTAGVSAGLGALCLVGMGTTRRR